MYASNNNIFADEYVLLVENYFVPEIRIENIQYRNVLKMAVCVQYSGR